MSQQDTPIVHQRRLRAELRKFRDAAGVTQKQAAERLDWSISKVIRIENGITNVGITDLRALLALYSVVDEVKVEELVAMARASRKSVWWTGYRQFINPQLYALIGYEASASAIRQFQAQTLPGLLQTAGYVQALAIAFDIDPETARIGAEIREKRQQIMVDEGPDMVFILDESILRRGVGNLEVARDQLQRIKENSMLPNISIRVLPFSAGEHPGLRGSFSILDLAPDGSEQVLVLEEQSRDYVIRDNDDEVTRHLNRFDQLLKLTWSESRTLEFIDELITETTH
ncbi:helix-turn-helix domain-containing protein [Saccharothrix luteola]|uniref:helix-turn-helix domain-containing protein n=1 Tax=Saccharothrix luteola TaxID=2893018 RepID=UPI001E46B75B|nr:helix-turn-helix transcriptional regulator [Saccharothrix luteola]MCC8249520.1 helix-turn-helix domain-containing protein [Saccharothrix luteola]